MKKPSLWDRGMITGGPGQKPDWKKMTGLSDSDLVTGGLILIMETTDRSQMSKRVSISLSQLSFILQIR